MEERRTYAHLGTGQKMAEASVDSVEALAEEAEAGSGQVALEAPPAEFEPEPVPEPTSFGPFN
jgi:hypothetical protein